MSRWKLGSMGCNTPTKGICWGYNIGNTSSFRVHFPACYVSLPEGITRWFGKGNSLKKWQFLVSMLDFWGVNRVVTTKHHHHLQLSPSLDPSNNLRPQDGIGLHRRLSTKKTWSTDCKLFKDNTYKVGPSQLSVGDYKLHLPPPRSLT